MKFYATEETLGKVKELQSKAEHLYKDGEESKEFFLIKVRPDCDQPDDEGDMVSIWTDNDCYQYRGEKGLKQFLNEWKEKKDAS